MSGIKSFNNAYSSHSHSTRIHLANEKREERKKKVKQDYQFLLNEAPDTQAVQMIADGDRQTVEAAKLGC